MKRAVFFLFVFANITAGLFALLGQGSALFILSKQVLPEKITAKQL